MSNRTLRHIEKNLPRPGRPGFIETYRESETGERTLINRVETMDGIEHKIVLKVISKEDFESGILEPDTAARRKSRAAQNSQKQIRSRRK